MWPFHKRAEKRDYTAAIVDRIVAQYAADTGRPNVGGVLRDDPVNDRGGVVALLGAV